MPRGRRYDQSASSAAQHAAQRLLSKKGDFQKGITTLHKYNMTIAESLSHGGPIESSLLTMDKNEHAAFLETQRDRLKLLAESNIESMHMIEDMLDAVQSVGNTAQAAEGKSDDNDEEEKVEVATDYKALIQMKLKQKAEERSNIRPSRSNRNKEPFMKECLERLGETPEATGGGDDDDDDLEVVQQHDTSNDAGLKCPITSQIFTKPYRNKVCGHVYEYDAILSHLRIKKRQCPVAGCVNSSMDVSQLEEDVEMKMKVHRFRKRQEQQDRLKLSQVRQENDYEEDYDDEEEDNNGTTLIR